MKISMKAMALSAAALAFSIMPGNSFAKEYPDLNLKYALYFSENVPQAKVLKWWGNQLKERSGGKIKIKFFWSQSLGKSTELLELVSAGAVNFSSPAPAYYASKLPLVNVHQLPMVFPTNVSAQLTAEKILAVKGVKEEHARNNVVPVLWTSLPIYHVLCNKEIRTLSDFKGVKMRSYGEYVPQMWDALGAVSVTVLAPEIYEGLQRGNIDCSYLPDDFANAYKLYEVTKYFISANFGAISAWPVYVNADQWKSWSDEVRALFAEVGKEAAAMDRAEILKSGETAKAAMLKAGMKFVEFTEEDKLRKAVPDFVGIWLAEMDRKGLGDAAREVATIVRKQVKAASQ